MEAIDRDHSGDVLDEGDVVVAGLGGVDSEFKCRGRFCPVKLKSKHSGLNISVRWKPLMGAMVMVC